MMSLKYLFSVQYKDGSTYAQRANDLSLIDSRRSSFYDVDITNIKYFSLASSDSIYTLDLDTGMFNCNDEGWTWLATDNEEDKAKFTDFKLVYFRRVTKDINIETGAEIAEFIEFHIGWTAKNKDGETVQFTYRLT